jgi:hypothetical protein
VPAVLATGDRRVAEALLEAYRNGGNWRAAFRDTGIDPEWYASRPRPYEELLPWEHIFLGVRKDYLWREWQRALELDRASPASAAPEGDDTAELIPAGTGASALETLRWQ